MRTGRSADKPSGAGAGKGGKDERRDRGDEQRGERLELGRAVYESGSQQGYVYFPTTSIVSLLYVMENGSSAQTAVRNRHHVVEKQLCRWLLLSLGPGCPRMS